LEKFQEILPDVKMLLTYLKDSGFEVYWQETILPKLAADLERVGSGTNPYNIVPQIESVLGFGLPSDSVTVSLVYFEWPYGHHILGTHFSTIPKDEGVIRTTIHELLHNPFNNTDPAFWKAANSLKNDPQLTRAFDQRDPGLWLQRLALLRRRRFRPRPRTAD
jgi:hypothetical protein